MRRKKGNKRAIHDFYGPVIKAANSFGKKAGGSFAGYYCKSHMRRISFPGVIILKRIVRR